MLLPCVKRNLYGWCCVCRRATEGQLAQFKITAVGLEPLKYEWFKDDRKLTCATADSPLVRGKENSGWPGQHYGAGRSTGVGGCRRAVGGKGSGEGECAQGLQGRKSIMRAGEGNRCANEWFQGRESTRGQMGR